MPQPLVPIILYMWKMSFQIIIPLLLIPLLLLALWRVGRRTLKVYHSKLLGKISILQKYNGEKILVINTYDQGISINKKNIEQSYWYFVSEQIIKFCANKEKPQTLMLGLGAGTISNLIAKKNSNIRQTIIEIDKFVIQACKEYFNLDKLPNYQLLQDDAYRLLQEPKLFNDKFDIIIVDIYIGKAPFVSPKSNKPNFINKLLPLLKKEGMIIFNRPAESEKNRKENKDLENYLKQFFKKTEIIYIKDPRMYKNDIVTAQNKIVS